MSVGEEPATIAALRDLEITRCRAISNGDSAGLAALLADDLTHTHVNGMTQDKAHYLAGLTTRPRVTTLGELQIRVIGDAAVMVGTLRNAVEEPAGLAGATEIHALRVWRRTDDGTWRLFAFAASGPLPTSPGPERQQ